MHLSATVDSIVEDGFVSSSISSVRSFIISTTLFISTSVISLINESSQHSLECAISIAAVESESYLYKQVSKLLSVMYVAPATSKHSSIISDSPTFTESHYSSYFHQATVGANFNLQSLSHLSGRCEGSYLSRSSVTEGLLRLPKTVKEIEEHAIKVLKGLPSTTIVVMSLLDNSYTDLLQEFACKDVKAWMLVSRLSSKMEPVVVLLPVYSLSQVCEGSFKVCTTCRGSQQGALRSLGLPQATPPPT